MQLFSSFQVYEESQNDWQEAPSMSKHRGYPGVVSVGDTIYALGGIGN